jgi:RNA polymerase sigma-70 factor (ECF subfamily)
VDERTLVAGILKGEEQSQEALVRATRLRLLATAYHFLGYQDADAEDVVQETFLLAFQKLPEFEFRSGLYLWLNRICVNHCLRRLQKRQKLLLQQDDELEALSQKHALHHHGMLHHKKAEEEQRVWIKAKIAELGEPCATLMQLRHVEGLPYAALGKKMKWPLGTVMSRLARCRESLKQDLLKEGQA